MVQLALEGYGTLRHRCVGRVGWVDVDPCLEGAVVGRPVGAHGRDRGRRELLELLQDPVVLLAAVGEEVGQRRVVEELHGKVRASVSSRERVLVLLGVDVVGAAPLDGLRLRVRALRSSRREVLEPLHHLVGAELRDLVDFLDVPLVVCVVGRVDAPVLEHDREGDVDVALVGGVQRLVEVLQPLDADEALRVAGKVRLLSDLVGHLGCVLLFGHRDPLLRKKR
mmetsp:Transcript_15937/g.37073  ORF Transcript_15937/g.37073 Transcript_15937/m.37073 type:complete len:224 (-) Transcript_15937:21-692(-)